MRVVLLGAVDGVRRRRGRSADALALARKALDAGADGVEVGGDGSVLAGAFEQSRSGSVISVAVAGEAAAAGAIEVARAGDRSPDLWLRSADLGLLGRLADAFGANEELSLVYTRTARLDGSAYEREAVSLSRAGVSAVRLPWDTWSLGLTTLFDKFGLRCQASGVRETRHLDRLVAAGVEVASVVDMDRIPDLVEHRATFA